LNLLAFHHIINKKLRNILPIGLSRYLWNMSYTLVKQHQAKIYAMEVEKGEGHRVFILSAFPEFLIDYFGVKLWKTCVKYKMQCE